MYDIEVESLNIFPTVVMTHNWQEVKKLNKEIKEMLLKEAEKTPSIEFSNVGGYHSTNDLLSWDYPCVKELVIMIQSMAQIMARNSGLVDGKSISLSLTAWGNIIENGHYHVAHRHPNNTWSGCYYIDDGNPEENTELNGVFEFLDPRDGSNMIAVDNLPPLRYQIKPKPGLMILFPSWLDHFVHPYIGENKRISIAFNVRVIQ